MITVKLISRPEGYSARFLDVPDYFASGLVSWRPGTRSHLWRPPTDLFETEEAIFARVEIAGVDETDFNITAHLNFLHISGVRYDRIEKRAFYQMEIPYGEFGTDIELIEDIDIDKIQAVYENGFLLVTLPKARAKQIKINPQE